MNKIVIGNILDISTGIITHQVNSQGVMGAGLAKQIREKYPVVYRDYETAYRRKRLQLGQVIMSHVGPSLWVGSIVGQATYKNGGGLHTNYMALRRGFTLVNVQAIISGLSIYIPYRIGCGLGGGDWNIVSKIIEETLPDAIIVKLEDND